MPIHDRVNKIISETLGIPQNTIKPSDKIIDLISDSIQLFELLIKFEKELGKKVSYEDISHIEKVEDIIKYAHSVFAVS
jgi:acyl carrier protein